MQKIFNLFEFSVSLYIFNFLCLSQARFKVFIKKQADQNYLCFFFYLNFAFYI